MKKIRPKISQNLKEFIHNQDLFALKRLHEDVIHIGFPQEMRHNIQKINNLFDSLGVSANIYLAHKSTKNQAFVKEALKHSIGIDVASKNDLISALSSGFTGKKMKQQDLKITNF